MNRYLSIDTEATGLESDCLLIQLAVVPIDIETRQVKMEWGKEWLVKCPSFETLKPNLNEWVVKHMEKVIRSAAESGIPALECRSELENYLKRPEIASFFGKEKVILLGKSMAALDIPLLNRTFSWDWMQKTFHHHSVDITAVGRAFVDGGLLPDKGASTTKLMQYFKLKEVADHTALSDAVDMAQIYLKLLEMLKR